MKKLVLAVLVLDVSLTAGAVPATPKMKSFTQSDGSTITVGMRGDEWFSSVLTTDGYTIGVGANGDYYYKTLEGLTTMRAHDVAQRDAAEKAFLAANGEVLTMKYQAASLQRSGRALAPPRRVGATQVPTSGTPRIPIILVQYTDKRMSNPKSTFIAQYTSGERSAYQYFADQSWNQYQPQFDVYGIYTLPNKRATYGAHGTLNGVEFKDVGLGKMVNDAIEQAGDKIDWSLYDNDNNGDVDVCIVVYAGVGEAQAYGIVPNAVWPCQWNLSSAAYYGDGDGPVSRNGKTINRFAVFNEVTGSNDRGTQIDGVGTFCHEFSHCLGLPDFYETADANDYYGMGSWSIMCTGCYNNDGYTPCGYTAYEKSFMGWLNLTDAVPNTQYTLDHIANEGAKAVKITSKSNSNEYYILENRQQEGWNAYIASSGLMVNHVTYNASAWSSNTVNNTAVQRMTIIPADNSLQTNDEYGDLYPYYGNDQLTDESNPAATLNTGGMMGQPVTKIENEGSRVSFYFMEGVIIKELPTLEVDPLSVTCNSFTATWNEVLNAASYRLEILKENESQPFMVIDEIEGSSYTVTQGLEDGEVYVVRLRVNYTDNTLSEDYSEVTVVMDEEPELYPTDEDSVTETSFIATWRPMKRVKSFDLQVVRDGYSYCTQLLTEQFSRFTKAGTSNIANSLDNYLDNAGWRGTYLYSAVGGLRLGGAYNQGALTSPMVDASEGDSVISVVMKLSTYGNKAEDYTLNVGVVGGTPQSIVLPAGTQDTICHVAIVCDVTQLNKVSFAIEKGYPIVVKYISIYAGEVGNNEQTPSYLSAEDICWMIKGIDSTSCLVENLSAGVTYNYRLRALRGDDTYTGWTPSQQVTMKGVPYVYGDVNLDGFVDVADVNILINIILLRDQAENYGRRAYITGDDVIDISDVNALINIILAQ